mgnify:CR=1 FL=1
MNYLLLYFFAVILSFSIIGHGYLLSKIINKDLLNFNIGYQGLLGILFLTMISYITIFFTKHGYIHNIILHVIGVLSFIYFFKKKKIYSELSRLILIFTILFILEKKLSNFGSFTYFLKFIFLINFSSQ